MSKYVHWMIWLLLGGVLVPLGNMLGEVGGSTFKIFGAALSLVGAISAFLGIYGMVINAAVKVTSFFIKRDASLEETYKVSKNFAVKVIIFLCVWVVSYTIAETMTSPLSGTDPFILAFSLSILTVYIWGKVQKRYFDNKIAKDIISRMEKGEDLSDGEALELLFSESPAAEKHFKETFTSHEELEGYDQKKVIRNYPRDIA